MKVFCEGFAPVFDENSRVLILGSFPSVKSRAVGFYYGNPQNAFWRTLGAFFGEELPKDIAGRREYLLRRRVALWDVVMSCTIEGSADASIEGERVADIAGLVAGSRIRRILLNGATAYKLFIEHFPALVPMGRKLPSTSPANPRFSFGPWMEALSEAFSEGADEGNGAAG